MFFVAAAVGYVGIKRAGGRPYNSPMNGDRHDVSSTATTFSNAKRISAAGWRIVLLASLGGTLEFYDFVIFGIFAKDIADAIFPNPTPLISLMVSFAAFAAGYLARPIGGIVLSHFGDRYGRRRVFLISIFVMSGATLGMGLVPSFATWGPAASVLMVVLRLVQGFCLGGELPGALTYVVETAPRQAPFVCTVVFSCVTLGVAMATGVSLAVRTWLPAELVATLGWRIAFVLGGLGGLLSFALRRSLEESPEFARMKQLASRQPFRELLQTHLGRVAVGVCGAGRDRRIQRPVLRAHGGLHVGRPALRPAPGRRLANHRRHRPRPRDSGGGTARRTRASAAAAARGLARARGAGVSVLRRARRPDHEPDAAAGAGGRLRQPSSTARSRCC